MCKRTSGRGRLELVLDRNTAANLKRATEVQFQLPAGVVAYRRRVRLVIADALSANTRCEVAKIEENPTVASLHLLCDVHRCHNICGNALDVHSLIFSLCLPRFVSDICVLHRMTSAPFGMSTWAF